MHIRKKLLGAELFCLYTVLYTPPGIPHGMLGIMYHFFQVLFCAFYDHFLCGSLPWEQLHNSQDILEVKQKISAHELYHEIPQEFSVFPGYCCSLSFNGKPDCDCFFNLFYDCLSLSEGLACPRHLWFDWDVADGQPKVVQSKGSTFKDHKNKTSKHPMQ